MKIAFIVPGGVDRSGRFRVIPHYLWLFEELAKDHDVHVISLYLYPEPCRYTLVGAKIYDLGNIREDWENNNEPHIALRNTYIRALEILQANGPWDVIHGFRATQTGWLAATIGQYLNIPSVVSFLGTEVNADQNHWIWLTASMASCLTVASNFMAEIVRRRGFTPHLLPFGVHNSCFQLNETQDKPTWQLLSVADINVVKDYPTMLLTLKRVIEQTPQVHLDIIGVDTLDGKLHSLIDELGLTNHVTVHGFMPNDLVRPFFQRAHIYLVTSRHEGGPIAMLEAAACGVPTVGTRVGYVSDWAGTRALTVNIGDTDGMVSGIISLLQDSPKRKMLGMAAHEWVRTYDVNWTAHTLLDLYRSL